MPSPMPNTDAELVRESRQGRAQSFGLLVERHQRLVRAVALCVSGNLDTAEELAQEAFVTAWTRLHELREPAHFSAWVCGMARNLARGARRHQARHAPAGEPEERLADVPVDTPSPLDAAIERQERALLHRVLTRIPESYREPLVLFYGEDLSITEVARKLGLNRDTVKQRLSRGRRYLERGMHEMLRVSLARPVAVGAGVLAAIAELPRVHAAAAAQGILTSGGQGAHSSLGFWSGVSSTAKLAMGSVLTASITLCALVVTPTSNAAAPPVDDPAAAAPLPVFSAPRVHDAPRSPVAPGPSPRMDAPVPVAERVMVESRPSRARARRDSRVATAESRVDLPGTRGVATTPTVVESGPTRVSPAHPGPSLSFLDALSMPREPEPPAANHAWRLPIEPPDLAARIFDLDDI